MPLVTTLILLRTRSGRYVLQLRRGTSGSLLLSAVSDRDAAADSGQLAESGTAAVLGRSPCLLPLPLDAWHGLSFPAVERPPIFRRPAGPPGRPRFRCGNA